MKLIKQLFVFVLTITFSIVNAQEKKIKFNKGTLKICSSKNFQIEGYDGDEVIIKSLHEKRNTNRNFLINGYAKSDTYSYSNSGNNSQNRNLARVGRIQSSARNSNDSIARGNVFFFNNDNNRKEGLKKLGKKNENSGLGIYFTIEKNGDELIFKDNTQGQFIMMSNESYLIKIPNSIKLDWKTQSCTPKDINVKGKVKSDFRPMFYNSKASILSDFTGEVEISSTLSNLELNDVSGPVLVSTLGGNVTIKFDKKTPNNLYSIYSNNGFIDITLPTTSDVKVDATGNDVFSDIDFKVEEEKEENGLQHMRLKLKSGKVRMKLNANLGNIYLRKK